MYEPRDAFLRETLFICEMPVRDASRETTAAKHRDADVSREIAVSNSGPLDRADRVDRDRDRAIPDRGIADRAWDRAIRRH